MHHAPTAVDLVRSQRVRIWGNPGGSTIVFGHGFGWTQEMWRDVAPAFSGHEVVLFDHIGGSGSDATRYDPARYSTLDGYAADLLELLDVLGFDDVVYVGHSVSATIGALAAIQDPARFAGLVLVSPSARYTDDVDYVGGASLAEVEALLATLEADVAGWARAAVPTIVGNPDKPWLAEELIASFSRLDPSVAGHAARTVFLSDHRADLPAVGTPALVIAAADDPVVPAEAARYVHENLRDSELVTIDASGHAVNLAAPHPVTAAIAAFLVRLGRKTAVHSAATDGTK